jgi:SAM-dependent methyltransferase
MTAADNGTGAAVRCILCGGDRFVRKFRNGKGARASSPTEVYRITRSNRSLVHAVVRCVNCGLAVLPAALHTVTPNTYVQSADPSYTEEGEQRIENAERLLRLIPQRGRLLDVGCACGYLLLAAQRLGFVAQGLEPSVWAAEYARREFGLSVWQGLLQDAPFDPASFDVIVLADTIEHLEDPRTAVGVLRRWLAPGGYLLLLTPDIGSAVARLLGVHWWGLLDDHYFYFNRGTLRQLLESEGFWVERMTAFGRVFALSHWLYKLSQYSPHVHHATAAALRTMHIDRLRLPLNLGDMMACIARKPVS